MSVYVCVQVSSSPASLQLLSILQALLALGPERSDVWLALEAVTNRAILLAQDCKSALNTALNTLTSGQRCEEANS